MESPSNQTESLAYNPNLGVAKQSIEAAPPTALKSQEDALASLSFAVKLLEDRLKPVLRPDYDKDAPTEPDSNTETAIYRTTSHIRKTERWVNSILERLEV